MSNDEECNCAQSLRLKKEVEELQERFMRLRRDVIEIVLWEKKGIAEATTVEPPEGWAVRMGSKLAGGWWRKNQYGDERWYESRAEAVAACWAAYRAQQPATVAAPEPHRSQLIHGGLHGGNSDPHRCVCAEKETGRYADTPHVHCPEPPYACARGCGCKAYDPAVPPAPEPRTELGRKLSAARAEYIAAGGALLSVEEINAQLGRTPAPATSLEAQLAEAEKACEQAYGEWIRADNAPNEKVHGPARAVKHIKALIAARDRKAGAK